MVVSSVFMQTLVYDIFFVPESEIHYVLAPSQINYGRITCLLIPTGESTNQWTHGMERAPSCDGKRLLFYLPRLPFARLLSLSHNYLHISSSQKLPLFSPTPPSRHCDIMRRLEEEEPERSSSAQLEDGSTWPAMIKSQHPVLQESHPVSSIRLNIEVPSNHASPRPPSYISLFLPSDLLRGSYPLPAALGNPSVEVQPTTQPRQAQLSQHRSASCRKCPQHCCYESCAIGSKGCFCNDRDCDSFCIALYAFISTRVLLAACVYLAWFTITYA
jgi:hypothetical protein